MSVDAVIVSYNSRDTLRACVDPLLAQPDVAVIVVDNDSPDGSLDAVQDLPLQAIQSGRNAGFGAGCNLGAAAGSSPYVLFVNPDAAMTGEALSRMIAALEAEPDVALVGPRLVDESGELMHSVRRYPTTRSMWARALFLHRLWPRAPWANEIETRPEAYERAAYPEWVSGACMLVRRDAFEAVGGFDDRFFMYCEDQDLCRRLRAAGGRVRYEPSAVVSHRGGHSAPRTSLYATLARSRIAYTRKHSGVLRAWLQHAAIVTEALTHALAGLAGRPAHRRGHAAALRASLQRLAADRPAP
ncbi:MAG: glycosyltransferase family 2 protein [Solirubrobacteraceae bacterium]